MNWREWFMLTRRERRAAWVLLALIALSIGYRYQAVREQNLQLKIDSLMAVVTPSPQPVNAEMSVSPSPLADNSTPRKESLPTPNAPKQSPTKAVATETKPTHAETKPILRSHKFTKPTVLDLNRVDSATLVRVPGIGAVYARSIVAYRERLGGYCSVEQLREVTVLKEGAYEQLSPWFATPDPPIRWLNINKADFKQLVRHPYIGYERAKTIANRIRRSGVLTSLDELSLLDGFSKEERERLLRYIEF